MAQQDCGRLYRCAKMRLHASVVFTRTSDEAVIIEKFGWDINATKKDRQLADLQCEVIH